ncbi:sugar transferase [Metabacillus endolithicus]|nr:sugar transferase [Metabacillus endolithicus]
MLIIALVIKCFLGSPIIFIQKRSGLYGRPFFLYKFRSMTNKKDKNGELLPDFDRLTTLGKLLRKYSVDEFPQLINVFKGDISIVGPRPLLMEYLPLYTEEQLKRHKVKPGITGWAQINGRNAISWEDKFELDVWYVEHQSFFLDLKILFLTVIKVFKTEGINQPGNVTMEKFRGSETTIKEGHG